MPFHCISWQHKCLLPLHFNFPKPSCPVPCKARKAGTQMRRAPPVRGESVTDMQGCTGSLHSTCSNSASLPDTSSAFQHTSIIFKWFLMWLVLSLHSHMLLRHWWQKKKSFLLSSGLVCHQNPSLLLVICLVLAYLCHYAGLIKIICWQILSVM